MANQTEHWTPPASFPKKAHCFIDMLGVDVSGYTVTRRAESNGNEACWQLTCSVCERTRIVAGAAIRRTLAGDHAIARCKCDDSEDDTSLVEERLDVSPKQARVLCAVVAHERAHGIGPRRKALELFVGGEPQTMMLVRRGLLIHTGSPAVITATPKTWNAMRAEEETRT